MCVCVRKVVSEYSCTYKCIVCLLYFLFVVVVCVSLLQLALSRGITVENEKQSGGVI